MHCSDVQVEAVVADAAVVAADVVVVAVVVNNPI